MRPFKECPAAARRQIKAVLCDIDDTLTWQGRLPAAAYAALEKLRQSGLIVVPVTGRPAGWCDHIARMWPVDGVVGENGAFYFHYDEEARRMLRSYWRSEEQRREDRVRLDGIAARVLGEVRGAAIAADQSYREADLAVDFREDVAPLAESDIARIVAIFEEEGAIAKVSSIHVNGWYGDYDKLSMTRRMLGDLFGIDIDAQPDRVAFVGDSPNDSPMFAFFPNAVGVSNVNDFAGSLQAEPAWVTDKPGGEGFAEFAERLLEARA